MNPHVLLKDEAQIRTVESLKRLSPDGKLYYMESVWDYSEIPDAFKNKVYEASRRNYDRLVAEGKAIL